MQRKDFQPATSRIQEAIDQRAGVDASAAQAQLKSVYDQLEAIACGEIAQVLAQAVPDVTLDIFAPPEFPWIRHAQGTDAVLAAIRQNFGSVDDQRPEITGVFADGNTVVLFGCESGRFRDTGANYEVEFVERFTFRDERLISIRIIGAHVNAYGTTATRSGT